MEETPSSSLDRTKEILESLSLFPESEEGLSLPEEKEESLLPLRDWILLVRVDNPDNVGGIYIPQTAGKKVRPYRGRVKAIGSEVKGVSSGEDVYYNEYAGMSLLHQGVEHIVIKIGDVVCKVTTSTGEGG